VIFRYTSAIAAVTTSRKIMLMSGFPYLLCTFQFLTATAITLALQWGEGKAGVTPKPILPGAFNLTLYIGMSYTFGFIFTNVAISLGELLVSNWASIYIITALW
jgi:hypothetical protein